MANSKADKAWSQLLDKYHILQQIADHGIYEISAEQIKGSREPRLLAKWDSSEDLPDTLSKTTNKQYRKQGSCQQGQLF